MGRKAMRRSGVAAMLLVGLAAWVMPIVAQKPKIPPGKTPALAKEIGALLDSKNLTTFAAPDPATPSRYVAALYTQGAQILLVAAVFQGTDIDYYLYQKDYQTAFSQLRASTTTKDRFAIEDIAANGLVPQPAKGAVPDVVTIGTDKHPLDGDFSDIRVVNRSKISFDDYSKFFNAADEKYAQALEVLIAALKK